MENLPFPFPLSSATQCCKATVYRVKAIKARVGEGRRSLPVDPPPPGQTFDTPCKVNFRVSLPSLAPPLFEGYEAR